MSVGMEGKGADRYIPGISQDLIISSDNSLEN